MSYTALRSIETRRRANMQSIQDVTMIGIRNSRWFCEGILCVHTVFSGDEISNIHS
jgi:hypothetical protein